MGERSKGEDEGKGRVRGGRRVGMKGGREGRGGASVRIGKGWSEGEGARGEEGRLKG